MNICKGILKNGDNCSYRAKNGQEYCRLHTSYWCLIKHTFSDEEIAVVEYMKKWHPNEFKHFISEMKRYKLKGFSGANSFLIDLSGMQNIPFSAWFGSCLYRATQEGGLY